jgi:hypothetical protein
VKPKHCLNPRKGSATLGARRGFDRDGVPRIPERRDLGGRWGNRRDLLQSRDRGMRTARQRQQPASRRARHRKGSALPVKFRGSPAMRGSARATATSSSGSRGGDEADGAAELASEPVCDAAILPVASIVKRDIGRTNPRMCALRCRLTKEPAQCSADASKRVNQNGIASASRPPAVAPIFAGAIGRLIDEASSWARKIT